MKRYFYLLLPVLMAVLMLGCSKDQQQDSFDTGRTGTGGSLARFIIVNNYLYVVDDQNLIAYDITSFRNPKEVSNIPIGFNIETIYNMGDKLFIGSQNAMYIYSIKNPSRPAYEASATHLRACDPVVANEAYAYVTVRSSWSNSSACGGNINALLVYDIADMQYPRLVNTLEMYNPHGLALYGNTLYVCDGTQGLKIFDISDTYNSEPQYLKAVETSDNTYFDCIAKDGYLYTMMENGFVIYDISNPHEPRELGKILH